MKQRTTGQARTNLATLARHAIADARKEMGPDLDGGSLTDLLLDNLPLLVDVADARDLLVTLGEWPTTKEEWIIKFESALVRDGRSPRTAKLLSTMTAATLEASNPDVKTWPPGAVRPRFETRDESDVGEQQKP